MRRRKDIETGIMFNKGRIQPFTVWVQGEVIKFTESRAGAEQALVQELQWRESMKLLEVAP